MKKYLIIAMLIVSPFLSHAQVAPTYATTDDIQTLKAELIDLITKQIALLQAQIDEILQAQNSVQPTPSAPQQAIQATAPSISFGSDILACDQFNRSTIGAQVTGVNYTSIVIGLTGMSTQGEYYKERNQYDRLTTITMPGGVYNYTIKAWSGATAPFTEGTYTDTRPVVLDTGGTVEVPDCTQ